MTALSQTENNVLFTEAKKIFIAGALQLLSDNYAFKIFIFLGFFLNKLHSDSKNAAASGLALNFLNFLFIATVSFLFGISTFISETFSKLSRTENEDEKNVLRAKIQSCFQHAFVFAMGIATPLIVLPLITSEFLFTKFGKQDPEVANIAAKTLTQIAWMVPPTALTLLEAQFFVANRKTKIMLAGMACLGGGLFCATASGFGLMGFPKKDVEGVISFFNNDRRQHGCFFQIGKKANIRRNI